MAAEGNLVDLVKAIPTDPESYFQPTKELPKDTLTSLKRLFDFSRQQGRSSGNELCPLNELMVVGFDDEQIWQQIELQNEPVITDTKKKVRDVRKKGLKLRLVTSDIQNGQNGDSVDDEEGKLGVEFEDSDDEDDALDSNMFYNRVMMPASSSEDEDEIMGEVGDDEEIDDSDEIDDGDDDDDDDGWQSRKQETKNERGKKKGKSGSVVDDRFFKLSEMTEFLDKMDQDFERKRDGKQDDDDDDEIDYFMDIESNEDEETDEEEDEETDDEEWGNVLGTTAKIMGRDIQRNAKNAKTKTAAELKYGDYFDPPDDEKQELENDEENNEGDDDDDDMEDDVDDMDEGDMEGDDDDDSLDDEDKEMIGDEDEENNNKESLSKHEKDLLKMEKKITRLEKENLSTKPWQMSGEAGSTTRPFNSLLEEDLNFDHTTAVAPPITEETTKSLEDIIKQRIKDESWDDVERKQKPVTQPYEYKKKQPLDQEKSKLSLSHIYEQEYVKQTHVQEGPKEEEEIEGHKEIKELMSKLFTKLDALSNFHFTPKPLKPEVKIVTNTPVISMEEVAPVAASDAMLLAPEETHEKKVELKGDTEKTDTDRKRERRAKKLKQRLNAKEQFKKKNLVNKLNPGLGNKYAKKKALKDLEKESKSSKNISVVKENAEERTLKSSSAFFSRLHDEVKQQVHSKKAPSEKKKKKAETSISKLKL